MPTPNLTRGQSQASGKEVAIESLTLFAYPTGSNGKMKAYQLMNVDENKDKTSIAVEGSYTKYTLSDFPNGNYKFYLVANVFSNDTSQSDLESAYENVDNLLGYMVEFTNTYFTFAGSSDKYLPMSAAPSDFWNGTDADTNYAAGVEVSGGATLYADMTFGVAKVTVQVEDEAGGNVGIESASLSAYAQKFPAIENTQSVTTVTDPMTLSNATSVESGTGTGNYADNLKTYTFYVPENTLSNSKMTLGITPADGSSDVDIELGERNDDGQVIAKSVKRGRHFDYLVTNKGDITLNVMDWSPDAIATGVVVPFNIEITPNYISELASGQEAEIDFRVDDGINVSGVSPKINGQDLFGFRVENSKLIVFLSGPGLLEYNKLQDSQKSQYHYFHLKALNLMKRINIGKLSATPFFTVSPQEITLDMREKIASGINNENITISFDTSLPDGVSAEITSIVTPDGGTIEYTEANYKNLFYLDRSDHASNAMKGKDQLVLKGMTDGDDFWREEKTVIITYTAYGEGAGELEGGAQREVVVKIIPHTTTYKIHLKAEKNAGEYWTDPHIYVYQVLEFPSDLAYSDGVKLPNAGGSVSCTDEAQPNAALQYLFTGDIAFKGWKYYGGADENDPFVKVEKSENGFWRVKEYNNNGDFQATNGKRYKVSKFNENAAADINVCGSCKSHYNNTDNGKPGQTYYNRTWPGLRMTTETDDWFTYELSGMAEPGRTLIMFAEGHGHNGADTDRFPGNNKVGVPLFDYPDKEGWIVVKKGNYVDQYDVNYFVDDKPSGTVSTTKTINIYLYSPTWSNPTATIKNGDVTYSNTSSQLTPVTGKTVYKYTATVPAKDTKLTVSFANGNGSGSVENVSCHSAGIPYNEMIYDMTTGQWYGYDSWKALASVPDNQYRLYVRPDGGNKGGNPWDNNIGMYVYKIVNGVKTKISEGEWNNEGWSYTTIDNVRYYYKDFKEDAASFTIESTMLYPDVGDNSPNLSGTITVSNSLFTKETDESIKKRCHTITAYKNSKPGKP